MPEEWVKSLCVGNQIWRDLTQANVVTANALCTNLEQVLAQVSKDDHPAMGPPWTTRRTTPRRREQLRRRGRGEREAQEDKRRGRALTMSCRKYGKEEASVLLLPCRHLCLCAVCGSSLHTCPLCNSPKSSSVHLS